MQYGREYEKMNKAKVIGGIVGLLYLPLGFYLTYLTLAHINATELMWFVWIISIPMIIVVMLIQSVVREE